MGKVKITAWVDEDVYKLFRDWVWKKHGKVHSALGEELSIAMLVLMNLESQENPEEALFKTVKPSRKYIDLLRWLYDKGQRDELITDTAIKQYIRFNLGVKSKSSIYSYYNFAAKIHNIELEEPARTTVKEPEPSKVTIRGFEVSLETIPKKTPNQSALAEIVMDLYQSGYSASEIVNKLEALGLNISANRVLNIIRKELKNEFI